MSNAAWPDTIFEQLLAHHVQQVAYVPDAGHSQLIERCRAHADMITVPLTTEEEGVALLGGAWLGGQRGVLLMQSSGVGNCINMLSLTRVCRFPLLMLVTMRGQWGEFNPWQIPMGQRSEAVLQLANVLTYPVEHSADMAATVDAAARIVFNGPSAAAVLISQRLIGAKTFGK
ncbi:MAG: phosphonopyruvate decarboxylase [Candidatus Competibacteraceae bacterium]|nr:phosphonopyruvate decarboxylase [Candidatus Competibacteraceae bacterium]MCB1815565.1 phosphonopyruvate decarboxylase [Candidatus Competibacteraceae bacterium]